MLLSTSPNSFPGRSPISFGSDPITGSNAILSDPRLAPNYHLRTGSPAIDQGLTVPWLTSDLDGNPRTPGAYDIGAFEGEEVWYDIYLPLVVKNYPLQMAPIFRSCSTTARCGWQTYGDNTVNKH